MNIRRLVRKRLWAAGVDAILFTPDTHPLSRRQRLLRYFDVDTVLDIGASSGEFGVELRALGYSKRIVSFEPLGGPFAKLAERARKDPAWDVFNFALGDADERRTINISANSDSSSLLGMLPVHARAAPKSRVVGSDTAEVRRLDSIFADVCPPGARIYMKIDTQGFESRVLRGATASLPHIATVQMEMSLVPLYDSELIFEELYALMSGMGYQLVGLEPGFAEPESGRLLQLDGIFHRVPQGAP